MAGGNHCYIILSFSLCDSKPPVSQSTPLPVLPPSILLIVRRSSHESETPALRRAVYQLHGEETEYRKQLIITAFYEALQFADGARKSRNSRLFRKYFRLEDRATVDQVFANILGTDPRVGAPQLGDITVLFGDPYNVCRFSPGGTMAFSQGPPATITVCDALWRNLGMTVEHKTCNQLGSCASEQMTTISSIILHEFT